MADNEPISLRTYKQARTKITREVLRAKIDGEECLTKIAEALVFLQGYRAIEVNEQTGVVNAPAPLDNVTLSAVKAEIDTRLKLLNKVLPDLKAIELKDTVADSHADTGRLMSDTELVLRLRHLGMQAAARASEEPPEPTSLF